MALFGSDENKTIKSKKIRPVVLRIQNVAKELLSIAKSYEVKVDTIDFNILDVQTFTRIKETDKETEWEEVSSDSLYQLDDKNALLNASFQLKQMYEVEFFTKKTQDNPYLNFNVAVGVNATKCKVYLSIKEGSKLTYSQKFEDGFKNLINKSKMRAGILINIFDEMLDDSISKFIAHARVEETVEYARSETILIGQSHEPTLTIDDSIILHYDKAEDVSEHHKMDYSSRGFIKSVHKDEVLIEYTKIQLGKPGRNCRGEYMAPKETEKQFTPTFTTDDSIRVEDSQKKTLYIANENGYVTFEANVYGIKTEVESSGINFKSTGNITSGLDSNVNINVVEKDTVKDAIGMGMEVEVTEIDIEGNVGSNAKLRAMRATISGQTHTTAEVTADKLNINVHKGHAYGKHIHVTRLEHGTIEGDDVDVSQALGGVINAKEITLEICTSHVKATATKRIEIKKLQGSENIFTIDPLIRQITQKEMNSNDDAIKKLEIDIRATGKDKELYSKKIKDSTASFVDIKKRLIHYKKNGIKMPESFVKQYKQFQRLKEHLSNLIDTHKFQKNELEILKSKTSIFQEDIMDARIINKDGWRGYNELVFKMINPPLDVVYKPAEGSNGKVFGLVEVGEGEFEIKVLES